MDLRVVVAVALWCAASSSGWAADVPRQEMTAMAVELGRILPLVLSDAAAERPQVKKIGAGLDRLTKAALKVEATLPASIDDPIMKYIPTKLSGAFKSARRDLKQRDMVRLRARLLRVTSYCIGCHTRTRGGDASVVIAPDFGPGRTAHLDKAEFYAATRQFSAAIVNFEYALNDQVFAARYPGRWEVAAKKLLALTVRVEQRPRLVVELLAKIRDSKTAPARMSTDIQAWTTAVKAWTEEPPAASEPTLDNAKRLLLEGEARVTKAGSPDAGLVEFLRSSAMTHLLLLDTRSREAGEVMLLAGQVAEKIGLLNLTTLHEIYYEACIRHVPHTATARACLNQLKSSQMAVGVTDHGKLVYSDDVYARLDALEELAKPK
jgi:hypothetical protein